MTLNRQSGFTMVEMIMTVAVGAILLTIGIPSFRYVTNSNRIAAEINGLVGDLQFARSEAIKEGVPVSVCISSNGTACAGGGIVTWQSGWIVISSAANTGVLRVQAPFSSTDTFVANNAAGTITFNRDGYANGIATGTLIELHDRTNNHNWTRCLAITLSGLIASQTYGTTTNGFQCQ
jgi:type IV fimbrial biogenesis protein FimT